MGNSVKLISGDTVTVTSDPNVTCDKRAYVDHFMENNSKIDIRRYSYLCPAQISVKMASCRDCKLLFCTTLNM